MEEMLRKIILPFNCSFLCHLFFVPTFGKEETNDGQMPCLAGRVQRELSSYLPGIVFLCEIVKAIESDQRRNKGC